MLIERFFLFLFLASSMPFLAQEEAQILSKERLDSLLEKGRDYYYSYDYINSIETETKLIKEALKAQDYYYAFRGYIELGHTYSYVLKDSVKGRINYENALKQAQRSQEDSLIAWAYGAFGNLYSEGGVYYDKAIAYYQKSIKVKENQPEGDIKNIIEYMNIGWTYTDLNEPDKAYPYLIKTKELAKLRKQSILLHLNLQTLFGRYYHQKGFYSLAVKELKEVAEIAEKRDFLIQAAEAHKRLSEAYEANGDFQGAFVASKKEAAYNQRLYDKERLNALEEASAKFALQQYESDLEVAQKEKEYNEALVEKSRLLSYIFIGSFAILLIAFVIIFRLSKTRKKFIQRLYHKNLELTQAKEETERLSKLKTQFFSTISHELRTPLYGVVGISSILLEDKTLASHQEDLKSLKFSADYLLTLINDVLTLNKIDANGVKIQKTPFSLSRLMQNIIKTFSFSLEQNKNKIHLHIDEGIPDQLLGDSVRLSQVLMNLVGNAVKFNENGNIWLSIQSLQQQENHYTLRFMVKDDGMGIPKDKQAEIFEEFSQVENRNYNYQGTGLGLPIVKKLLLLFGSEIQLKSDTGHGAEFSFELVFEANPEAMDASQIHVIPETVLGAETKLDTIEILVVDDNRINQKITQKILEQNTIKCALADNGEEAIEMVKARQFDMVLMDIHMPGIDGIQATKKIREFDFNTPIIALTAVEIDEMRKKILDSGMNDIILKPYDVSQFLNTILKNLNKVGVTSL